MERRVPRRRGDGACWKGPLRTLPCLLSSALSLLPHTQGERSAQSKSLACLFLPVPRACGASDGTRAAGSDLRSSKAKSKARLCMWARAAKRMTARPHTALERSGDAAGKQSGTTQPSVRGGADTTQCRRDSHGHACHLRCANAHRITPSTSHACAFEGQGENLKHGVAPPWRPQPVGRARAPS